MPATCALHRRYETRSVAEARECMSVGRFPLPEGRLRDCFGRNWRSGFQALSNLKRLLSTLGMEHLERLKVRSTTMIGEDRIQLLLTGRRDETGRLVKILVDAKSGVPTWEQYLDATYNQPVDLDSRILVYDNDRESAPDVCAWGDELTTWNLVARNNRFGMDTYQVYAHVEKREKGRPQLTYFNNEAARSERSPWTGEEFPKREDLELLEFWMEYFEQPYRTERYPHRYLQPEDAVQEAFMGVWGEIDVGIDFQFEWNETGAYLHVIFDGTVPEAMNFWRTRKKKLSTAIHARQPGCEVKAAKGQNNEMVLRIKLLDVNHLDLGGLTPQRKCEIGALMNEVKTSVEAVFHALKR